MSSIKRIAILGDAQLIADEGSAIPERDHSSHWYGAWRSYRRLLQTLQRETVDMLVLVGDLVDYFSTANMDLAVGLLNDTGIPWVMTPGNHDFTEVHSRSDGSLGLARIPEHASGFRRRWTQAGVELGNRQLSFGDWDLWLVDSHDSRTTDASFQWLRDSMSADRRHILITHVPPQHPTVLTQIGSRSPQRSLTTYVQDGSCDLFTGLPCHFAHIFCGHLHYSATLRVANSQLHILPLSIETAYHYLGEDIRGHATATILELSTEMTMRIIQAT